MRYACRAAVVIIAVLQTPLSVAQTEQLETTEIYRLAGPAVCLITTYNGLEQEESTGTGFLVNDRGWIATNDHVIKGAARATVKFMDGQTFDVIGRVNSNEKDDLALLKIEGANLPAPIEMGNSSSVEVGQEVIVIGHPLGRGSTATSGEISSIVREEGERRFQMTAPVSSGSSGSPVLDRSGKLIAITVATLWGGQNLNLAVPVDRLQNLIDGASDDAVPLALSSGAGRFAQSRWINLGISLLIFAAIGLGVWRMNQAD